MNIILPIIILGSLGAIFGLWLTFAQKIFAVKKDERTEHIFSLLPGSNCGACGQAGCYGLAEALTKGDIETISCPVADSDHKDSIASVLGIKVDESAKEIATLICGGGTSAADKMNYHGPRDCSIAMLVMDGPKRCSYGCIGLGSCVESCPFDAIVMGDDDLPLIDPEKCTSCGKCIKICPKDVLVLTPLAKEYHVMCNSKDKGPDVMKACKVGCIGCGKCVKGCPVSAINLEDNLAVVDYKKCNNIGKCMEACPTKAIVKRSTSNQKPVSEVTSNQ
ncbi:RnfABCDGE type electron transport complex subunit B [Candidatus Omnitrophota bacterium]